MNFKEKLKEHYEQNRDKFCKGLSRVAGGLHNAEDVIQEAYALALQYQHTYDTDKKLDHWFRRILQNSLRKHLTEQRLAGCTYDIDDEDVHLELPVESTLEQMVMVEKLKELRTGLNSTAKEIVELTFDLGLRPREIKQMTGFNIHTINTSLARYKGKVLEAANS